MGIQDIMSEIQNSKEAVQSVILMVDDATKSFSTLCHMFLVSIIEAILDEYNENEISI